MDKLVMRKVGNSLGAIFPKEFIIKMHLKEGDTLFVTEDKDGVRLTPYDPLFEKAMGAYERVSRRYRNTLRALAKEDMSFAKDVTKEEIIKTIKARKTKNGRTSVAK